ncbi:hypothetical protein BDB00DRAFT_809634 [Zychaea mexicana]|uniref:uncharacterized protein n=1 Tax=Zychaea mexicana TaxID=64656 RepID=UPI0022FF27C4|nr:uncharacterized protein BDB00DRAFT_809634 [Zychaea mexicana]KAI9496250.1 hypothetical protein BDB00DRAFT_809634 [Zychaea mexicana]
MLAFFLSSSFHLCHSFLHPPRLSFFPIRVCTRTQCVPLSHNSVYPVHAQQDTWIELSVCLCGWGGAPTNCASLLWWPCNIPKDVAEVVVKQ